MFVLFYHVLGQRGQVSVLCTKCGESLLFLYLSGAPAARKCGESFFIVSLIF